MRTRLKDSRKITLVFSLKVNTYYFGTSEPEGDNRLCSRHSFQGVYYCSKASQILVNPSCKELYKSALDRRCNMRTPNTVRFKDPWFNLESKNRTRDRRAGRRWTPEMKNSQPSQRLTRNWLESLKWLIYNVGKNSTVGKELKYQSIESYNWYSEPSKRLTSIDCSH